MLANESSVDNGGKDSDIDEKKFPKTPQSLFGFLDCKNINGEDDSDMHESVENLIPPKVSVAEKLDENIEQEEAKENVNDSDDNLQGEENMVEQNNNQND